MRKSTKTKQATKQKPRKEPRAPRNKVEVVRQTPYPSIGAQIGDSIQKWGTSLFNRIIGSGDYKLSSDMATIQRNDLFADAKDQPPAFSGTGHTFLFEHSEYIGEISSSSTVGQFTSQSFTVNPTNNSTFPWLSGVAQNFETYEIDGMIFEFKSTSGSAVSSTNSALGSVMATYVYDTLDPSFINMQQMLQYDGVVNAKSSENFLVGVECARGANVLSTLYNGIPPAGSDPKFYNHGKLHIASEGMQQANQVIGQLWVHYKLRMKVTKDLDSLLYSAKINSLTSVSASQPFGLTNSISGQLLVTTAGTTYTVSNATIGTTYCVQYILSGTAITAFTVGESRTGCVGNTFIGGTASASSFNSTGAIWLGYVTATSTIFTETLVPTITATSLLSSWLILAPIDQFTL
jgi:hypothetical protein